MEQKNPCKNPTNHSETVSSFFPFATMSLLIVTVYTTILYAEK